MSSTTACLSREIHKWLQSLDLSYAVKNVRRDFASGYLIAEILSRYYRGEIQLSAFDPGSNSLKRKANWMILKRIFNNHNIPISDSQIRNVIFAQPDAVLPIIEQLYSTLTQRTLKVMRPAESPEVMPSFAAPTAHTSIIRALNAPDMKHNQDIMTAEARAREALDQHNKKAQEQTQQLRTTLSLASARQQYTMRSTQRGSDRMSGDGDPEGNEGAGFLGDQTVRFERVQVKQAVEEQLKTSPTEQKTISGGLSARNSLLSTTGTLTSSLPRASATGPKWGERVSPRAADAGTGHDVRNQSISPSQVRAGITGTLGAIFASISELTDSLISVSTATNGSASVKLSENDVVMARNYFADPTANVPNSAATGAHAADFEQIVQSDVTWGNFSAQDKIVTVTLEALATRTIDERIVSDVLERLLPASEAAKDNEAVEAIRPGDSLLQLATESPMQFWTYLGFLISIIGACAAPKTRTSPTTSAAIRLIASLANATKLRVGATGLADLVTDYGVPKLCSLAVTTPIATPSIASALLVLFPDRANLAKQIEQQLKVSGDVSKSSMNAKIGNGLSAEVVSNLINALAAQDPLAQTSVAGDAYISALETAMDGIIYEVSELRRHCQEDNLSEEELIFQLEARIGGLSAGINALATVVLRLQPGDTSGLNVRAFEAIDRCSVLAEELVSDTFEAYSSIMSDVLPEAYTTSSPHAELPAPLGRWVSAPQAFTPPRGAKPLPLGHDRRREAALRDSVALAVALVKFYSVAISRSDLDNISLTTHLQAIDRLFALATVYGIHVIPAVGSMFLLAHPTLLIASAVDVSVSNSVVDKVSGLQQGDQSKNEIPPVVTELLMSTMRTKGATSAISAHPHIATLVGIVTGCHQAFAFEQSQSAFDGSIDTLNTILPHELTDETNEDYLMTAASLTSRSFIAAVRTRLLNASSPFSLIEGDVGVPTINSVIDSSSILKSIASDSSSGALDSRNASLSRGQLQLMWTSLGQIVGYPVAFGPVVSTIVLEQLSTIVSSYESIIPSIFASVETNPAVVQDALAVLGMAFMSPTLSRVARALLQDTGAISLSFLANKLANSKYCQSSLGQLCAPYLSSFFGALQKESQFASSVKNLLKLSADRAGPAVSAQVKNLLR